VIYFITTPEHYKLYNHQKTKRFFDVGASLEHVPPLPIPNREVKVLQSDDTCRASGGESRMCRHQSTVSNKNQLPEELIFVAPAISPFCR